MNIFDNLIQDTEIIGIGMYNSYFDFQQTVTKSFKVFTKSNCIIISSDGHAPGSIEEKLWITRYLAVRKQIAEQIREIQPAS